MWEKYYLMKCTMTIQENTSSFIFLMIVIMIVILRKIGIMTMIDVLRNDFDEEYECDSYGQIYEDDAVSAADDDDSDDDDEYVEVDEKVV